MTDGPVATASRLRQDAGARDAVTSADALARYQTRVAARSAQALAHSRELLAWVSRGLVTAADLETASRSLMHARAGAQARDLADVYARFFAGLAGEVAPPQPLDAADPAAWFEQLAALAMQASQDRVAALHIDLAAAAERSGQSNASRRSAAAGQVEGAARLARLTTLYVELIDGISEAASAAQAEYLQAVLAAAQGTAPATRGGLQLEGRVGDAAEAWMAIENSTAAPVTIHCSVGPVRRADGINPAFAPDVVVTPAHVLLEAGEDAQVRLQVVLDAGHYEAGAVYVGTLYVHRDGDPCRDVPLRIVPARAIERAGAR